MTSNFIGKKFREGFLRDTLVITIGTSISQLIPMLFYPIIARLFLPEDFGLLATITSITIVLSVIATGKYETAILIANNKRNAANILFLSLFLSAIILFISFIFICCVNVLNLFDIHNYKLGNWIYLSPVISFFIIIYQCYNEWCVKNKYFVGLSINKITNTLSVTFSKAFLGWIKIPGGLIIGEVFGRFVSAMCCVFHAIRVDSDVFSEVSLARMKLLAKRYINCPKYIMPAQLMNTLGGELPVFILALYFGAEDVGYYAMSLLILSVPSSVLSLAIRDVFRKRANDEFVATGDCRRIYLKTLGYISIISIIGFSLLYYIAPGLFAIVLGNDWRIAGEYAKLLVPMIAISFVTEIGTPMFIIAEKMKYLMTWQICYLLLSFAGLIIGITIFNDIKSTLVCFTVFRSLAYIISAVMSYRFTVAK